MVLDPNKENQISRLVSQYVDQIDCVTIETDDDSFDSSGV